MSDSPELVVVAAFTNVHEALLAQAVIEASGIDAVLDNEHIISMDWALSNAVGGVKVLVSEDRLEEARQILETAAAVDQEDQPPAAAPVAGDVCGKCGGDAFESKISGAGWWLLTFLIIGAPIGNFKRERFCRRCGARAE